MKKFIFLLIFTLLLSISSFSQTERDQKPSIHFNSSTQSFQSQSRITNTEVFSKREIRREQEKPKVNTFTPPSPSITVWNDKRLENITKGWSVYLGFDRELKYFGFNLSLGIGNEQENFQFYDEFNILSNNGKYSFKNFVDNYVSMSFGLTHDYKFVSISTDVDPIRKIFWLGAGFNF
jgi:hypothetical protein